MNIFIMAKTNQGMPLPYVSECRMFQIKNLLIETVKILV
jgi:hypothetical protein